MKAGVLATTVFAFLIGLPIASMAGLAPDADSDGVPDVLDNCRSLPNAGPGLNGDCDTDQDGYGNRCDGDYNQTLATDGTDFSSFFKPAFVSGTPTATGTDMNCSGSVDGTDFGLFKANFTKGSPGASGLSCAGPTTGGCPN